MTQDLLPYYNGELAALRRLAVEFAAAHPKVAGRLKISPDAIEDPHVARLVESVAFLNARIRKKLDDDFPELTDALLSVLYPHFLAPLPSMAIAQFECDRELSTGYRVRAGTMLDSERVDAEPVRFRTAGDTTVWPIRLAGVRLKGTPFQSPATARAAGAAGVLHLTLEAPSETVGFRNLGPKALRFFLRGAQAPELYDLVFRHVVEVVVADSLRDPRPAVLGPEVVRPVGLEPEEGLLPFPRRSFPGYRLLSEYFAFPERFQFFDLDPLPAAKLATVGRTLEVFLLLERLDPALAQAVGSESIALNCAPVVNLFPRRAESLRLTQEASELRVVADARRPKSVEVYSIDRVTASSRTGETRRFLPFYGLDHGGEADGRAWWHAARRPAGKADDAGTEVFLSLVDLDFEPAAPEGWVLEVEVTCTSRDLPARLPVAPRLRFAEGGGPIRSIRCLSNPTRTLRREQGRAALWRLVSQLSLNHLSITGGARGAEALREILRLYDVEGSRENREIIEGLVDVRSTSKSMRVLSGGQPGFCRGTEVLLELDEKRFAGTSIALFGSVMARFLSLYGSVNTFVQLAVTTDARRGETWHWKPTAGTHPLL